MSEAEETKEEKTAKSVQRWMKEIRKADSHEKNWRDRANKIIKRFRDEDSSEDVERAPRFNILYANTEVLQGVLYQRTPIPDVRRRFLEKDPTGREAAQALQRALSYCVDSYDFDSVMRAAITDYLLPGRGLAKVKYVPTFAPMMDEAGEPVHDEAGEPMEQVIYETVETEYVDWEFVRFSPAKRWNKLRWIAFGELLTREELVKQFGELGRKCVLHWADKDKQEDDTLKRALVWTLWNKSDKKVYVFSEGLPDQYLKTLDDPLNLKDFWPCPKPIYSIQSTGTMIPVPEYTQYQDQAIELDNITSRIDVLVDALRRRGIYNASYPELEKLQSAGDNEFIAIEKYTELTEKGIQSAIWQEPIDVIAAVLINLYNQREQIKQTIYEVTGLADIVRGTSDSSETLGAQQLKARYAGSRTAPRQKAIQDFARDIYRLKAEIIAEKFSPQTLAMMTGFNFFMTEQEKQAGALNLNDPRLKKPSWESVMKLLKDEQLRGFRIDIETDSTIEPDAGEEQKNRIELLTAITQFIEGVGPAVASGQIPPETAKEMLSFGVRSFKLSPQLEDSLDMIGQKEENPQANQAQMQKQQQQEQMQAQMMQAESQKMQASVAEANAKAREAEARATEAEHKATQAEANAFKLQNEARLSQSTVELNEREVENAKQQPEMVNALLQGLSVLQQTLDKMTYVAEMAAAPRELILDNTGMPIGSKPVITH